MSAWQDALNALVVDERRTLLVINWLSEAAFYYGEHDTCIEAIIEQLEMGLAIHNPSGATKTLIDEIERLRQAGDAAFLAMCAYRDSRDDEVFQDAIDALGLAMRHDRNAKT